MKLTKLKKAIFLDRDGLLNKEVDYLSNPHNFEFKSKIDNRTNKKVA